MFCRAESTTFDVYKLFAQPVRSHFLPRSRRGGLSPGFSARFFHAFWGGFFAFPFTKENLIIIKQAENGFARFLANQTIYQGSRTFPTYYCLPFSSARPSPGRFGGLWFHRRTTKEMKERTSGSICQTFLFGPTPSPFFPLLMCLSALPLYGRFHLPNSRMLSTITFDKLTKGVK